ncbi:hypothetical protein [Microbacterium sp. ABRD28]|uniref:hypothetical protein n=1 Tax=Microbacterium sp. ABRD28 TaxID=2268461 RepID=UPI000F5580EF|nr:hypothetical protein [Microbacterium sp. ABRD28]AZC15150.1 hypothetical protein DT073_06805 [Microbacterium sp. ABRD28]
MISVRGILLGLAFAFTAYLAARGLWWTEDVQSPSLVIAALLLYLPTTWLCIFWEPRLTTDDPVDSSVTAGVRGPTRLPVWISLLAIANAVVVPAAISMGVAADIRTEPFATWYLGGIGALMTIVMARRRPLFAWIGTAILAALSAWWMGGLNALALGLVGSVVWVVVAQLLIRGLDRAARDTAQLAELQRVSSAWQASQLTRQRERRIQVQRALAIAGPLLTRTVSTGGRLTPEERLQARLAEGRLRDDMRGPRLLDDDVRTEVERLRRRGASVTMLDEGGLDGIDERSLAVIRAELAETLRSATSDRLYIRTSPHTRVAVTVVGRSGTENGLSDEDSVDLWREIDHPGR